MAEGRHSYLADVRTTREVLSRHGLYTKHRLGQNFLVNDAVIGKILELAQIGPDDLVLEVGPGIGTLTVAMLERAPVVSVEADTTLAPVLAETCARDSDRFTLVLGDALKVLPDGLGEKVPTAFVANLPYQVAATLILRVLEDMPSVNRLVVMVQAEVADRICAVPSTKAYGAYTAKLAQLGVVTGRFEVGPGSFSPAPHVNSAVVRIERTHVADEATKACFGVIDAAFAQRRKTIRNSMRASGFDADLLDAAFGAAGIEPTTRAETLSPTTLASLAEAIASLGSRVGDE